MVQSDGEDDHSQSPAGSGADDGNEDNPQALSKTGNPSDGTSNAKDPNRPRRKKARRACYACQRAHLTCGDERPCQRCIKRGLADVCQDGVRKKAKYLHDAPNEALLPGAATQYSQTELRRNDSSTTSDTSPRTTFFQPNQNYNFFNSNPQMPPPVMHERNLSATSFGQPSPATSAFTMAPARTLPSPSVTQEQQNLASTGWQNTLFDPQDTSLLNFDTTGMNFGNHYGALEFGILGHITTGAAETPESDTGTQRGSITQYPIPLGSFSESPSQPQYGFSSDSLIGGDWANGGNLYHQFQQKGPNAYAIETNPAHFMSPETTNTPPDGMKFDDSPVLTSGVRPTSSDISGGYLEMTHPARNRLPPISTPQLKARAQLPSKSTKRPRDPTSIYTSVTSPYPYTAGFHQLIAYLQRRFSSHPSKTLAIAKSLASIRPSFIATTKTLNREDLIFMEKCFQRTLWEYEGFIEGVGTPTIVARRTGEIAAVGKEFQILTGWKKDVLLGRAPNLNVNRGHSGKTPAESGANSTGRVTGQTTPLRQVAEQDDGTRQQPVFLAELLDDDSIVQFYEDFARLAFGDSRGSVMGKGKLLKYRTKDDEIAANLKAEAEARGEVDLNGRPDPKRLDSFAQARPQDAKKGISGEKGMQRLGSSDGKVDCAYCWTVKRDVFDIPMLIVMNFLPCI